MEIRINTSLAVCFALFVAGLVYVGADLLSALCAALLLAPLLVAYFTGPTLLLASLLCCLKKADRPAAEPIRWEERMD